MSETTTWTETEIAAKKVTKLLMEPYQKMDVLSFEMAAKLVETGFILGSSHELRKSIAALQKKLNLRIPMTFRFISDPGHGWLEVPLKQVRESGATISHYSYICGDMAYLEEDCDADAFMKTLEPDSFSVTEEHRDEWDIRENRKYLSFA